VGGPRQGRRGAWGPVELLDAALGLSSPGPHVSGRATLALTGEGARLRDAGQSVAPHCMASYTGAQRPFYL